MLQVAASICAAMLVFGMTMLYLVTVVDGMAILIVVAARLVFGNVLSIVDLPMG